MIHVEQFLNENIFDQQEAVEQIAKTLLQGSLLKTSRKVRAFFYFYRHSQ